MEAFLRPDLLDEAAAFERHVDDLGGVPVGARGQAIDQEFRHPKPLMDVERRPEQKRRVAVEQPFEHLERRGRIGPGLGMADRDLSAIGEARLEARFRLPVDHADRLAVAQIPIGGVHADNAGAENDHVEIGFGGKVRRLHAQCSRVCARKHSRAPSVIGLRVSPLALRGAAYTVGGSIRSAFQRLTFNERFVCLRVSGAVAPSAPRRICTRIDLSRSALYLGDSDAAVEAPRHTARMPAVFTPGGSPPARNPPHRGD